MPVSNALARSILRRELIAVATRCCCRYGFECPAAAARPCGEAVEVLDRVLQPVGWHDGPAELGPQVVGVDGFTPGHAAYRAAKPAAPGARLSPTLVSRQVMNAAAETVARVHACTCPAPSRVAGSPARHRPSCC